jgi:hypothetical protein
MLNQRANGCSCYYLNVAFRAVDASLFRVTFLSPADASTLTSSNQGPMLWFLKYFRKKIGEKSGVFDSKQS